MSEENKKLEEEQLDSVAGGIVVPLCKGCGAQISPTLLGSNGGYCNECKEKRLGLGLGLG